MSNVDTTVVITVRLDPEDRARIDQLAEQVAELRKLAMGGNACMVMLQEGEAVIPAALNQFGQPK